MASSLPLFHAANPKGRIRLRWQERPRMDISVTSTKRKIMKPTISTRAISRFPSVKIQRWRKILRKIAIWALALELAKTFSYRMQSCLAGWLSSRTVLVLMKMSPLQRSQTWNPYVEAQCSNRCNHRRLTVQGIYLQLLKTVSLTTLSAVTSQPDFQTLSTGTATHRTIGWIK